jgi:hypothetical protein
VSDTDTTDPERQRLLDELAHEWPDARERFGPGSDGMHELLDRAHLASDFFQRHVLDHPACVLSDELRRRADAIADLLADFYQRVGEES